MLSQNQYFLPSELSTDEGSSVRDVTFGSTSSITDESYQSSGGDEFEKQLNYSSSSSDDDDDSMSLQMAKAAAADLVEAVESNQHSDKAADESRIKLMKSAGNSTVVKIVDGKFVDLFSCCFNKEWIEKQTSELVLSNTILYQKYYLGPLTTEKAIQACNKRCEWHLFHAVEAPVFDSVVSCSTDLQLPSAARLFIVYRRNDNGKHEIYPIRSKKMKNKPAVLYVDYGDSDPPKFDTVFGLVKFYDSWGYVNVLDSRHYLTEVFPHWNCPPPCPTVSEYSDCSSDCSWLPNDSVFSASTVSQVTSVSSSSCWTLASSSSSQASSIKSSSRSRSSTTSSSEMNSSREGETDCDF